MVTKYTAFLDVQTVHGDLVWGVSRPWLYFSPTLRPIALPSLPNSYSQRSWSSFTTQQLDLQVWNLKIKAKACFHVLFREVLMSGSALNLPKPCLWTPWSSQLIRPRPWKMVKGHPVPVFCSYLLGSVIGINKAKEANRLGNLVRNKLKTLNMQEYGASSHLIKALMTEKNQKSKLAPRICSSLLSLKWRNMATHFKFIQYNEKILNNDYH